MITGSDRIDTVYRTASYWLQLLKRVASLFLFSLFVFPEI